VNKSSVVNASPLIFFSRSHQLKLLRYFAREIFVPEPVAMEIRAKGPQDITVKALEETPWLMKILEWRLLLMIFPLENAPHFCKFPFEAL